MQNKFARKHEIVQHAVEFYSSYILIEQTQGPMGSWETLSSTKVSSRTLSTPRDQ